MKLSAFPPHVQDRIRKQIAAEDAAVLGAVQGPKLEPKTALGSVSSPQQTRRESVARGNRIPVVQLVSVRRRGLDSDNLVGGFKPLRDAIARWIGVDDNDKFIRWEYGQVETAGEDGTIVRIQF